ncbi:cyclic lactone autoinducer peptide [Anaeromicropila populeti]|nr:cyclic lactone autoinducer peptide [Anaeromicropila populeti]
MRKGFLEASAVFGIFITRYVVNVSCFWLIYQEKLPANAKKLRKF